MSCDPDELIDTMRQLGLLLTAEDAALRRFDLGAIAAAAEAKLELQPRLEAARQALGQAALAQSQREQLLALQRETQAQARANLRRLRASLDAVGAMVDQLTGRNHGTYGRSRGESALAVLTHEVG
ncbi:MAG: hypothetical protein K1X88_11200 [Nannocystaceae bacterium]|nr:hypothetical protein [Nannocystaceae bacterium]